MSVRLRWRNRVHADQVRVYRSDEPFDANTLPTALATLAGDATSYEDLTAEGETIYYAVGAVSIGALPFVALSRVRRFNSDGDPVIPQPPEIIGVGSKAISSSIGHNIGANFPTGSTVGDLILVVTWALGADGGTVTSGTGWNSETQPSSLANIKSGVFWKVLDGTGDNLTLSTSVSTSLGAIIYRISNANLVETESISANTNTPNPPNLNTTLSGEKLWFAAAMCQSIRTLGAAPNGDYGNRQNLGNPQISVVDKLNSAASEDPGAFAFVSGTSVNCNAWTIAVGNAA